MTSLRSDVAARFDAVGTRFDELDHRADQDTAELRETRSEIVAQQNEILNALQAGLSNTADVNDLKERVEELERRIGR
jgi:tetrahydromethanopterin S-methyltransferase subunit G